MELRLMGFPCHARVAQHLLLELQVCSKLACELLRGPLACSDGACVPKQMSSLDLEPAMVLSFDSKGHSPESDRK